MKISMNRILRRLRCLNILLLLCLALSHIASPVEAVQLEKEEVRNAVQTWLRYTTADAKPNAVIEKMETHKKDGNTVAYVAHIAGGGFCLCGSDDLLLPVYLYSPEGTYNPDNPNIQYVLLEIGWRLDALQKGLEQKDLRVQRYQSELSWRSSFWQDLIAGWPPARRDVDEAELSGDPVTMELPLRCRWHQGSPYNDDCPNLTPGQDERTKVCCVATAMAQIMYYWKWPPYGTGNVPTPFPYHFRFTTVPIGEPLAADPKILPNWGGGRLWWDTSNGGTLWMMGYWDGESVYPRAWKISTDSAYHAALEALWNRMTPGQTLPNVDLNAPINWRVIQDVHTDPVDDGDPDVAALCYAVGVSIYVHYGVWSSSAFDWHIAEELEEHFYYDADAVHQGRDIATMIEEIQWFRVLEIGGSKPDGGHSWVAYGYDNTLDPNNPKFLMNMGGGQDGIWYTCDQVFPNDQVMTTRIAPLNVKFVGASSTGNGSPDSPYQDLTTALAAAPNGETLIFKAGSVHSFSGGPLVIDRPLTLKGYDVTIGQ